MLLPYLPALNTRRIILASASPRRQELLGKQLGVKFEVVVSSFEELLPKEQYKGPEGAARYAVDTARGKALDVARGLSLVPPPAAGTAALAAPHLSSSNSSSAPAAGHSGLPHLIIGADTVVEAGGLILEKPEDAAHAMQMLTALSGNTHHVHTGVVLVLPQAQDPSTGQPPMVHTFHATTTVEFDKVGEDALRAYIETGEPFGKAGSYGIQGTAGSFVRSVDGCYFNVVGFPLHRFAKEVVALINQGHLVLQ